MAGECTDVEMKQILQWLSASENNRKEWLKLRLVQAKSNYVRFSDPKHVDQSCKELRKEKITREVTRMQLEREITRKINLRFMRYAASILLVIGLTAIIYQYMTDWRRPQMVAVAVGANEQMQQITLEDSSRVWLSAGSRIEYPERFDKKHRVVTVEGKTFFEVAHDTLRPFYVKTDAYSVKVLGTSFEINAPKYSPTADATLVEGKVEIFDRNWKTLCTLQPGQLFEINKVDDQFNLHQVNAEMSVAWYNSRIEFDGLTLVEVAKALERYYGVSIHLDKGVDKNIELVGSLHFKSDVFEMMKAIEMVVPIKYQVQTGTVVSIQSK